MKYNSRLLLIFFIIVNITAIIAIQPKVGLTLSGGGAKGIAHIGVLKVLEEYNIKPEFITGTSMGSIIGALYSIGYSAEELEDIILSLDWNEILFDELPRVNVSMEEKDSDSKYVATFPIEKLKIKLPSGMVSGQNITQLLTKLTYGYHDIDDFRNLPIPFLCIATNIETGDDVVLDRGYLPEAIRASMSIPSMFKPVTVDSLLLVDGGLVRNFPVSDCKNMGADFVIGVDVGTELHSKDELNSMIEIMEQSIGLYGAENNKRERDLADILIIPEVSNYSITDFNKADSLIAIGERAARKVIPHLIKLQNRVNTSEAMYRNSNTEDIVLKKIKIEGLKNVSKNLVIGKMPLREGYTYSLDRIDRAVTQLYGTRFFNKIKYRIVPTDDNEHILIIDVEEKQKNLFRAGFHYDSDMKASILLNTTFRNMIVEGSKVTIDIALGDNKTFHYSEFIHTGLRPGFGFKIDMIYDEFDFIYRNTDGVKQAQLGIDNASMILFINTIFSDNFQIGTSLEILRSEIKGEIVPEQWGEVETSNWWLRSAVYGEIDTRNKSIYPTKGSHTYCEYKWFNCFDELENNDEHFIRFFLSTEEIIPLHKRFAIAIGSFAGSTNSSSVPAEETYYLGGFTDKQNGRPFTGYYFGEVVAEDAFIGRLRLQYEAFSNVFFIARWDSGRVIRDLSGFGKEDFWTHGVGLSFAYKTPIGPIEYTLMGNDRDRELRNYINIGYTF